MRSSIEILEILDNFVEEKGSSRRQFSATHGIPQATLGYWKTKNATPSIDLVSKIAKFMNVSLDWLVLGDEIKTKNNS